MGKGTPGPFVAKAKLKESTRLGRLSNLSGKRLITWYEAMEEGASRSFGAFTLRVKMARQACGILKRFTPNCHARVVHFAVRAAAVH
jgi:hypothetical protein